MSKERKIEDKDLAGIAGGTDDGNVSLEDKPPVGGGGGSTGEKGGGGGGGPGPGPETEDIGSGGTQDLSD
jgi:hypothetical protein